jgi:serine/threonine-protein kinase RsbW
MRDDAMMEAYKDIALRFRVHSYLRYTDLFESLCKAVFPEFGIPNERVDWLCLSVREAVNNAVLHGNKKDPAKWIEFEIERAGEDVLMRVWDEGHGFDQGVLSDPTAPENLLRPSGRGIFLIRQFVDGVRFLADRPGHFGMEMRVDLKKSSRISEEEERDGVQNV